MALSRSIENSLSISSSFYVGGGGKLLHSSSLSSVREKTQGKRACKNGGRHREKRGRRKQAGPATRGVCLLQCCWRWRTVSVGCTPRKGNGVGGAKREKREGMEIPHLTLSEGQEDEGARDGHSTLHCEMGKGGMWRRMNADIGRSGS